MTRYFYGLLGLAILGVVSLIGQSPAAGGEAACCPEPACSGSGGCPACGCNKGCCPHCGCKLVPACQMGCEVKKETIHKYCCECKAICIPGVSPLCKSSNDCCDNGGCCDSTCGNCRIREVNKLVIYPETKERTVRTCTVVWTCPHCGCGPSEPSSATPAPSITPQPAAPVQPLPARGLPPPPKTTDLPAQPETAARSMQGF